MQNLKASELKSIAREKLLGKYSKLICAYVMVELVMTILLDLVNASDSTTTLGTVIYYVLLFLVFMLYGLFLSGSAYLYLNFLTDRPSSIFDVFHSFRNHADKTLNIHFLFVLIYAVSFVPVYPLFYHYLATHDAFYLLCACVWGIGGFCLSLWFDARFSMLYYMLHDFPDYNIKQLISLNNKLIKGHVWQLLYLKLSFIPFYLLGLLTLGFGMIWVVPYINTTETQFYLELTNK